jgi:hypothetical protein
MGCAKAEVSNRDSMMSFFQSFTYFRAEGEEWSEQPYQGGRMPLDVHSLVIPDVKLIRTNRFSGGGVLRGLLREPSNR